MKLFRRKKYLKPIKLSEKGRILSFCITHQNRFSFLKKTLAKNLEDNRSLKDKIEFVLVDFSLDENVCSWIWNDFSEEIREGYLKFYQTNQLRKWSAPIAKNTSHKLANGEILTNLDCDNYVGANGAEFVIDQFKKANEAIILWQYSGIKYDGSFGRISIPSKVFKELGGYDESLLEMGWQDNDLMRRSKAMGLKLVKISDRKFNQAIAHEKYKPESMSFEQMNKLNEKHARRKIRKGQLVANAGNFGIANGMLKMNAEGKMKPTIASL